MGIGILGSVAMPNFLATMPGYGLKSAARDVCTNLRKARSMAIKENRTVAVVFDTGPGGSYTIDAGGPNATVVPNIGGSSLEGRYGGSVHFGFGSAQLRKALTMSRGHCH